MSASVSVRVLLFAALREAVGASEIAMALPPVAATSVGLLDALAQEHPEITPYRSMLRLAVNRRYVRGDVPLAEGDEVALITPVSGG